MKVSKSVIYPLLLATSLSGCGVTPKPLAIEEVADNALTDMSMIYSSQEPTPKLLSLSEAMARALKYNLDNRVKLMEQAVAHKSVEMAEMDMLPMLGISAGYLDRSNIDGSSSRSILTNRQSLEPSTSQDRKRFNADIRFTWNILDFGVSYMQARQNADRYLISEKTREKVMLKLLQQVRSAYWRAVVMQKLSTDVEAMLKKVDTSLADLKAIREKQLYTPLFALNDIRILVETKKELEAMKESITIANVELAQLINVPSKTQLILEIPKQFEKMPALPPNIEEMELTALTNSTEYITEVYNVRIDQAESHKALLRLLPGIEFSYAGNYASNSFLWNSLWGEAGVRLAGDLLKLLTVPDTLEYKEISHNLAISRRQAVNTSVVAGVHLAWQNYANALNRLEHSAFLNTIDTEIAQLTRNSEQNKASSEVEAIQNEFKAFTSEMAHLLAYAKAQDAYGSFLVSLGSNPVPEEYQTFSVAKLANLLLDKYKVWESGKLEVVDIKQMQKRITARKKKEAEQSVVDVLLEKPIEIDEASLAAVEAEMTPEVVAQTPVVKKEEAVSKAKPAAEVKKPTAAPKTTAQLKTSVAMKSVKKVSPKVTVAAKIEPVKMSPVPVLVENKDGETVSLAAVKVNRLIPAQDEKTSTLTIRVDNNPLSPIAKPNTKTAIENGSVVTGNILADDIAGEGEIKMTAITGTNSKGAIEAVAIGLPFFTQYGGKLTVQKDGAYSYTPPPQGKVPAEGVIETFSYTIKNAQLAHNNSPLQLHITNDTSDDRAWLLKQDADKFTFQLILLSKLESVEAVLNKYRHLKNAVKVVHFADNQQNDRYVMFYGAFASIGKAKMALKKLPREFKQVWIRNLIDVQNQLQSDTVVAKNQ